MPARSGDQREDQAAATGQAVAAIYAQLETVLTAAFAAYLLKAVTGRLAQVLAARRLQQIVEHAIAQAGQHVQTVLRAEYRLVTSQVAQILAADLGRPVTIPPPSATARTALDAILRQAGQNAAASLRQDFADAYRAADDAYRAVVSGAIEGHRGGMPGTSLSLSRIQAAQKALDGFAERGITGFTDRAGREWDLVSYTEMATRTAVSNLWDDLQAAASLRSGFDLAEVYTHSTEGSCPVCRPWLGRTISLSGATVGYPTFAQARASGWRHPQCRCAWSPLGAGLAGEVVNPVPADLTAAFYKASQRQRALERDVRAAGRASAVAVTPQARTLARRELAAARRRSAQHREDTGSRMTKIGAERREHPVHAH